MDLAVAPTVNKPGDSNSGNATRNTQTKSAENVGEASVDQVSSLWNWHIFRRILNLGNGLFGSDVPSSSEGILEIKGTENGKCRERKSEQVTNKQVELEEMAGCRRYTESELESSRKSDGNGVQEEASSTVPMEIKSRLTKSRERRSFSLPTNVGDLTSCNTTQSFWSFWKRKRLCLSCLKRKQGTQGIPKNLFNLAVTQDDAMVTTHIRRATKAIMSSDQMPPSDTFLPDKVALVASELPSNDSELLSTYTQRGITLFLLDWDDTLFASTCLASFESVEQLSEEERNKLSKLEMVVTLFLKALSSRGYIAIVTNADSCWVEMTCQRFMPKVYSYLQEFQVVVVSARNLFGSDSYAPISTCPSDWKAAAFLKLMVYFFSSTATNKNEILQLSQRPLSTNDMEQASKVMKQEKPPLYNKYGLSRICRQRSWTKAIHALDVFQRKRKEKQFPNLVVPKIYQENGKFEKAVLVDKDSFACHHIVVMGDACFEYNAVNTLRAQYPQAHFKFIQFISEPSMADLSQQLKSVYGALDEIGNFAGNLDVRLKPQ